MNDQVIGELVRAYVKARGRPAPLGAREVAGMLLVQYGARAAYKEIDNINKGATEGFWKDVLTHLEGAIRTK